MQHLQAVLRRRRPILVPCGCVQDVLHHGLRRGGEGEEEEEGEKSEKEDRSHGEDKDFRGVGFYRVSEVHDDSGNGVWIVENIREEEIGRNGSHGWPLTVVKIAVVDSVVGSINWAWNVKQVKPSHLPPVNQRLIGWTL
ncbi:unnamed protein product, partial [Vitis vinifera]